MMKTTYKSLTRDEMRVQAEENLGGKCAGCGKIPPPPCPKVAHWCDHRGVDAIFHIDHIEGTERVDLTAQGRRASTIAIKRACRGNTEGLQLLCPPCHWEKTKLDRLLGRGAWDRRKALAS